MESSIAEFLLRYLACERVPIYASTRLSLAPVSVSLVLNACACVPLCCCHAVWALVAFCGLVCCCKGWWRGLAGLAWPWQSLVFVAFLPSPNSLEMGYSVGQDHLRFYGL